MTAVDVSQFAVGPEGPEAAETNAAADKRATKSWVGNISRLLRTKGCGIRVDTGLFIQAFWRALTIVAELLQQVVSATLSGCIRNSR